MDAKDLRTESAVSERNNDGSKYSQSGGIALHCDRNKSYQDIGSNSLGKVDVPNARPCAVIGPDRVVPPPAASEAYHIKKGLAEPWPCMDNAYRHPPEYPHKLTNFQNPTRNISPRQTFQENMQRFMVPPTYNSITINDDTNYAQMSDRSIGLSKNIKLNMPPEAKFCDVPYVVNPNNNEQKNVRNPEMCLPSVNPALNRTAPHGWPPGSVNLRSTRMYGAPEMYQYQEYPSCAGPRPVVPRTHRTVPEEQGYVYADPYYQDGNIRFKPYPTVKERYPQQRYEYIGNYSNPFHPPPGLPTHKYELQKSLPPHPYPPYPSIKYLDSRVAEPVMEGYQRNPQGNYNIQYRNQLIHSNYGPVLGNCPQSKMHSYPPDAHIKTIAPNKLPCDNNTKTYVEYDNNRTKLYPPSESYFINEMARMPIKGQVIMPNYPTLNMHNVPPNTYYKKDNQQMKNYEHMAQFRHMDPSLNLHNPMTRHAPGFSPNTLAISPTDSNTSNDTTQTLGTSQDDCGYVSQSSTASVRSMDSGPNRIPNDYLRKYYDNRYGPIVRTSPMMSKSQFNSNNNISKNKKQIDVRQFLQMWNEEGDEEVEENSSKEIIIQTGSSDKHNFGKTHVAMNNQEQLYVLGLVNVPSEELAKYEHIQKVSKLPENIRGYNSIELLNQFEEVIESSNMNNYKTPNPKDFQMSMKGIQKQVTDIIPSRPVSPLDVEAKISQSIIHKEVGCNFEIKPCSPKMLNVEVAAPVQNILAERSIEKVANTVMIKSPMLNGMDENMDCNLIKRPDHQLNNNNNVRNPSCKMIKTQFSNSNTIDPNKNCYSLQDFEGNSGLCLASLPRLDNDIELNFPEVNQQFINANKGDSTVLTTSLQDLPTLDVFDQSDNPTEDKFDGMNSAVPDNDFSKSPYIVDSEKEFSKLSKYRKNKINSGELKDNQIQPNANATRTDSVIIKNPENTRNYEENSNFSSNTLSKGLSDTQQGPINLTSQGSVSSNNKNEPTNIILHNVGKDTQLPLEIAIDFSLNKTGILDNTICIVSKTDSQIGSPIHIKENPLKSAFSKNDSSDTKTFLISTEQTENMDIDTNCSPGHEINSDCKSEHVTESYRNEDKTDLREISSCNSNYTETDYMTNKCTIHNNTIEDMITDIDSRSLSITTYKEPDNELTAGGSSFSEKEIDKHEEKAADELSRKRNYTLMESDSEIPQKYSERLQDEIYEKDSSENCTNGAEGKKKICLDHTETKLEIGSLQSNYPKDIDDSVANDQTQVPQNIHCGTLLLTNEKSVSGCDTLELDQYSRNFIKDSINDKIEVKSTKQLLEELSDHERELKDFEEEYCEDSGMNSSGKSERFNIEKAFNEDDNKECVNPGRRFLRYGSKEIYSPWIQKLLMFTEGNSNNETTKTDTNSSEDCFLDTIDTVHSTKNPDETETRTLEPVPYKNVTEHCKQEESPNELTVKKEENINKTVKEIVDTVPRICVTPILDDDVDETVHLCDRFESECNTKNEDSGDKPAMYLNDNKTASCTPVDKDAALNTYDHFQGECYSEKEARNRNNEKNRQGLVVTDIINATGKPHDIDDTVNLYDRFESESHTKNVDSGENKPAMDLDDNNIATCKAVDEDDALNSYDHFADVCNSEDEALNLNNEENRPALLVDDIITASGKLDDIDKKLPSYNRFESESDTKNEDNGENKPAMDLNDNNTASCKPVDEDEALNSYDHFVNECNSENEALNPNKENRQALVVYDITAAGRQDDIDETEHSYDRFESESNTKNEDIGENEPAIDLDDNNTASCKSVGEDKALNSYDHLENECDSKNEALNLNTEENRPALVVDIITASDKPDDVGETEHSYDRFESESFTKNENNREHKPAMNIEDSNTASCKPVDKHEALNSYDNFEGEFNSENEALNVKNEESRPSLVVDDIITASGKPDDIDETVNTYDHFVDHFSPEMEAPNLYNEENMPTLDVDDNYTTPDKPAYIDESVNNVFESDSCSEIEDCNLNNEESKPAIGVNVNINASSKSIDTDDSVNSYNYLKDNSSSEIEVPHVNNDEAIPTMNVDDTNTIPGKPDDINATVNSDDRFESDCSTQMEDPYLNTEESMPSVYIDGKITASGKLVDINDTVKSYDRFEGDCISKSKTSNFNNEESKPPLGIDGNNTASGKPVDIDESVNSYDRFERDCSSKIEDPNLNTKENNPPSDVFDYNIAASGEPIDKDELDENGAIDPSLETENNSNVDLKVHLEITTGSPTSKNLNSDIGNQCDEPEKSHNLDDDLCTSVKEVPVYCDEQPKDNKQALEPSTPFENMGNSCNKIQRNKKCQPLKRSLSDSALNMYNSDERLKQENEEDVQFLWSFKRRKVNNVDNALLAQKLCNIINHNRRNSVSSFEENVSFCILIDNSCIITEEENEEPEKICYTELSQDYLTEIDNTCINQDENAETSTEVVSTPNQGNTFDHSDSFLSECEEEKTLEESWVEDVACVETVISDDIAEDIEISGPSSPKDDSLSNNDESGVFSSSEHTDKVKYIYGEKMCNEDAHFVETLYKTPQMNVNKTLYNRETRVSEVYNSNRYYDIDSLEKMLSEPNEEEFSPSVPKHIDSKVSNGVLNSNGTPENKENLNIETFPPCHSKDNALDIIVDIEHENMHSIEIFAQTGNDTILSCESSVENTKKDKDTVYTTSSSPEVSSTTSEEKNSGILLKITNYKGSRISQINDISRDNKRSSCKFTEDKEYLQSHADYPTNRPLLTKGAKKYIPPLKESIRDLKVKLSLPQHSLMKLKQLKISKDEPKANKQNATNLIIPKKPKPKFEDVLKSIDEIQFKMHKEKTKKAKNSIPKVVIKKNQNGSHYASTPKRDDFNPDLTGRKWQPWVFIEKNHFIDKMAIKKKTKAIYSHRKKTYVFAEKFQKYKSANSAKFVISPPISNNKSTGLKYTIRLKHNY